MSGNTSVFIQRQQPTLWLAFPKDHLHISLRRNHPVSPIAPDHFKSTRRQRKAAQPASDLQSKPPCKCPAHTATGESLTWLARAWRAGTVQQTSKMEKGHRTCGISDWSWDGYSHHRGPALFQAVMHRAVSVPWQVLRLHICQL